MADLFQDYPNVIRFNLVNLCPSMLLFPFAVFLLCCLTVLSDYCNVSFYFLGILGKKGKQSNLLSGKSSQNAGPGQGPRSGSG